MASGLPRNPGIFQNVPRPRAPPRLIRPPSPLDMERPQPIVPDVSLIMDSNATSFLSNMGSTLDDYVYDSRYNTSVNHFPTNSQLSAGTPSQNIMTNYYPTPSIVEQKDLSRSRSGHDSGVGTSDQSRADETTASTSLPAENTTQGNPSNRSMNISIPGYDTLKSDVSTLLQTVNSQTESISQINLQLQKIISFQEQIAVHFKTNKKPIVVSQSVQTEETSQPVSLPIRRIQVEDGTKKGHTEKTRGNLPAKPHSASDIKSTQPTNARKPSPCPSRRSEGKSRKEAVEERKTAEDFSAILRNLQISNDPGPSVYSDTSMRSIDCPPFNDDLFHNDSSIGPSASAQGSDVEDDLGETVVPTNTYYNNLITTVNRILDTSQKSTNNPPERPATPSSLPRQQSEQNSRNRPASRASNHTASYSNSSKSSSGSGSIGGNCKENCPPDAEALVNRMLEQQRCAPEKPSEVNIESTRKYLQSIGIQYDSPTQAPAPAVAPAFSQNQNYMIQQNVYNSIYIPTVNCIPMVSESMDSNSSMMDDLARKYIPSADRQQYEAIVGKRNETRPGAETTMYGMSPGNLSFATKEYLKKHGLVGDSKVPQIAQGGFGNPAHQAAQDMFRTDKILDITAIRNQPKLL